MLLQFLPLLFPLHNLYLHFLNICNRFHIIFILEIQIRFKFVKLSELLLFLDVFILLFELEFLEFL